MNYEARFRIPSKSNEKLFYLNSIFSDMTSLARYSV